MTTAGTITHIFSAQRFDVQFPPEQPVPPRFSLVEVRDEHGKVISSGAVWKHNQSGSLWKNYPEGWVRCWGDATAIRPGHKVFVTSRRSQSKKWFAHVLESYARLLNRFGIPKSAEYVKTLPVWEEPIDPNLMNILKEIMDGIVQLGFEAAMIAIYDKDRDLLPCNLLAVKPGKEWAWEWSEDLMGVTVVGNIIELQKYPDHLVTKAVREAAQGKGKGYVVTPYLYDLWGHAFNNFQSDQWLVWSMQMAVLMRSMIEVPLVARNADGNLDLVGNMFVGYRKRRVSKKMVNALKAYISQASLAIQNARLYRLEEVEKQLALVERQLAEEMRQLAEEKGRIAEERAKELEKAVAMAQVVNAMAHRLNNHLGLARSRLNRQITKGKKEQQEVTFLEEIHEKVVASLEAVKAMQRPFEETTSNPTNIMETILEGQKMSSLSRDVLVEIDPRLANLPAVRADSSLAEVFRVLLNNANEAMEGTGSIRITGQILEETGNVQIAVADTGPGIHPDLHEKIFNLLFTTKQESGGTGLGLWWVRFYLGQIGGEIRVKSSLGTGATFKVELTPFLPTSQTRVESQAQHG